MTTDITIFRLECCPRCKLLADLLQKRGVAYTERMMDDSESIAELLSNSVFNAVAPIVRIDGEYLTDKDIFAATYAGDALSPSLLARIGATPE
ncbi:MAG: glutaredoxin family protein [candidate division Zixibacteria bacterium]|jgi:glutaredoxin|nr:glutaredoxin family protein [candidate division Zixibacteria bacterium]